MREYYKELRVGGGGGGGGGGWGGGELEMDRARTPGIEG